MLYISPRSRKTSAILKLALCSINVKVIVVGLKGVEGD